jgi:formylglycine-generating enzyme required for sulfatase activity/TolB-like protein
MRNIVALALLCVLWTTTAIHAAGPQRHAVIIGINDYADPAIPDLKYAESDAKAVYDTLTDPAVGKFPKENVAMLLGKDATNDKIKAALYKLRGVGKDDLVVVFYSGHGAKEGDEAFWVTQNAEAKAIPATALPNSDIRKFLSGIPAQRLVILLDCCYAASTVKKSLSDPGKLFGDFAGKGRVTIAGAADNQEALEMPAAKAGVFTHFLVAGLRGSADTNADGAVTFDELWTYLGDNVRKTSVKQGGLHEPVIITEDGVTPQFLLTWNSRAVGASNELLKVLRKLFDEGAITGAQYDEGRKALTEPAIDAAATARREVYADLAAGRLSPKYLQDALARRLREAEIPQPPAAPAGEKPAIAIVPFEVYGNLRVKDAGVMLAERMLPLFGDRYTLIDQMQLRRFVEQDDLTIAGLAQAVQTPATKGLTKAVKLRAVRYLVVGSVSASPDGRLSITARLSDWQTGRIESGRLAQIAGDNWDDLIRRLPLLAAKLTGSLGEIGPGPNVALPPLPTGVDALAARILQLEAIKTELRNAEATLTEKHPRIAFLRENLAKLRKPLSADVDAKLKELQAADAKLADLYKEAHPQRAAMIEQMSELRKAQWGILMPSFEELIAQAPEPEIDKDKLTLDLGSGVSMKLALIPAGKFTMGSPDGEKDHQADESPQHEVTISKPFYMGVCEVTQEQYEQIIGKNPSTFKGAKNPVEMVSWEDAVEFCKKLSAKTGKTVSLPTEAQWEYACRAGSKTRFGFGDKDEDLFKYGNYCDKSNTNGFQWQDKDHNDGFDKTAPVGSLKPNDWGLYDMHGNVWEWCSDWYADSYANAKSVDPAGPDSGSGRVLRGGGWPSGPLYCRSAFRDWDPPVSRHYNFGFRVVVLSGVDGIEVPKVETKARLSDEEFNAILTSVIVISQIDQSLAKASMFLVNAKKISDLDSAAVSVREGKKLLDANRQSLSPEEYAKQLSIINDMLSEITKKRRVLAETKVESQ